MKVSVVSSRIHGYSYSLIACQAAYLATYFPRVCWNTAYLRVISGLESDSSTDYGKVAKGVGEMMNLGIKVMPVDINKSGYMFDADVENNAILYGMKGLNGVNGEIIEQIIANRPYSSLEDFMEKVPCNKPVMVSLIKSGAFDAFGERSELMRRYLWSQSDVKKRLTMQNFNALIEHDLVPQSLDFQKRLFVFNKALKKNCKVGEMYSINDNYYDFYSEFFDIDKLEPCENGLGIDQKNWKKMYDSSMADAKEYLTEHKTEILNSLNDKIFGEVWDKYAKGTYSTWEIDSMGFYYHPHELADVDKEEYGIVEFDSLDEKPIADYTFKRNGREIPIFKTYKICGTVIAKDDMKNMISILTPGSGVVGVKFNRDSYAKYNQRISEIGDDGSKHLCETGWFRKGVMLVVNGFRRENQFVAKAYKKSAAYQCYKITDVVSDGTEIEMTHCRYGEIE